MDDREQAISDEIRKTITENMSGSERSLYAAESRIGVSNLGHCREYVRQKINNEPPTDQQTNFMAAFVGTAVGDKLEPLLPYQTQAEVVCKIEMRGGYELSVPGHPDIIVRDDDGKVTGVWDEKTKDGLAGIRKYGITDNHKFQLLTYGKALIDAGEVLDPDNLELALIYMDRSGGDPQPYVKRWLWTQAEWEEVVAWLDDVVEALVNNERASRDLPRTFCADWCEFYTACWGDDTDVTGLIENPDIKNAVEAQLEGARLAREGEALKKSAKALLKNVQGNVQTSEGMKSLRWITVNMSERTMPATTYERLSLTRSSEAGMVRQITCQQSEEARRGLRPVSSLTNYVGGEVLNYDLPPITVTSWATEDDLDTVVLRDEIDEDGCRHYAGSEPLS